MGDHALTATAVYEATQSEYRYMDISGNNLMTESVGWWNAEMAGTRNAKNDYSKWALMSGVGRVMYNYKDRYMLTGTIRADGSSSFLTTNGVGFPLLLPPGQWVMKTLCNIRILYKTSKFEPATV